MWRRRFCLSAGALVAPAVSAQAALAVVYPRVAERPREAYGYRLLQLALSRCGEAFHLRLSDHLMGPERARQELLEGHVSVMDFGTSPEFEERFEPVFFPIDLGLSGYRRLLVRRERAAEFAAVRELGELRGKVAGQGPGWADSRILNAAGIAIDTAPFEALFRMLQVGRFDFFPLGIEEADGHLARYAALAPDCVVLDQPVLHYRFARLFFASPGQTRLRDALQRGLVRAYDDGSLRQLLAQAPGFAPLLRSGRTALRTVLELSNPWLSPRFKAMPARYFVRL